jgi:hypothetical protein
MMNLGERVALDIWAADAFGMDSDDVDEVIRRAGKNPTAVSMDEARQILEAAARRVVQWWMP